MLMKEGLSGAAVKRIAAGLGQLMPVFDASTFEEEALSGLESLELKARVSHLIGVLHGHLPQKFSDAARVLQQLPKVWDYGDPDDPLKGFAAWPLIDYIAVFGLDAPKLSLRVMEKLTPLFSAEFAIRPFIERYPDLVFKQLYDWVSHPDAHVRRLVSEGARPRLPWGGQLKQFVQDPSPCIPLLEALKNDESQYVRRSVANHLNDIGKDHPELLVELCMRWRSCDEGKSDWVISHGTRSLVKAGHPAVFALLGYHAAPKVEINDFVLTKKSVRLGGEIQFQLSLLSQQDQRFVLDYVVYYVKANGSLAPKVYKLKNLDMSKGESLRLTKGVSFKPITTRKYYVGTHCVALQINGVECARLEFNVKS